MTHQLILNFENTLKDNRLPDDYVSLVRDVIQTIIDRHGAELWGRNQIMRGPVDLLRRSESVTLEAKSRKLSARISEVEIDAAKYDRQGMIDTLVEEIVGEFRAELARYAANREPVNFYPYHLLYPSGLIVDPSTNERVMHFITRYATKPQSASVPKSVQTDEANEPPLTIAIT